MDQIRKKKQEILTTTKIDSILVSVDVVYYIV